MKKGLVIAGGVIALLAVMVWADHKFPAAGSPSSSAAAKPTDAPTVTLKDLNDKDVTIQDYKGKVVLVNFWATWCAPCKVEIPWMIEFQQKYGPRGFTLLGVSMDEDGKKAIEPFLEKERFDVDGQKLPMSYPILLGNDAIADKFGGILGLPTSMLFNRDGKKVRTIVGLVNHDDISKAIEGLL
ncbi:MAG TPA: TlpA disulfide reductase family protein [Verrucomicrobiae bacterium]|jgi:thiol-disulfide isomerase/thioredoxin|nr:TlpA disulfide reductase family protein [Verrucomicrobiae bacterium]